MTEHNDKMTSLPAEPESLTEQPNSQRGKLFRLCILCLSLLMFTALILVGGSFSKNTSSGEISGLKLTVAGFNVTAEKSEEYEGGTPYDKRGEGKYLVFYAFTITINSDVEITYDMTFDITFGGITGEIEKLNFILVDDDNGDKINFHTNSSVKYSTVDNSEWTPVVLTKEASKTYVLVADCSALEDLQVKNKYDITISGTITVTATQVKGAIE